ncbi:hypothetical protein [Streptomyces sp. NPDC050263]|uniref:hypothetical protein n=1 Tax=Streptomyces sp. NPDC050263 TaxID=3155037 RepID=UPI0034488F53
MRPCARTSWHPTPYRFCATVVWSAMSLVYWLDPLSRAAVADPVGLLVLLTGIGRFTRVLTDRRWAPVLGALSAVALLWAGDLGQRPAFAVGLTFWAWASTGTHAGAVRRTVRHVGPSGLASSWGYGWLGALYGLILLVDPVTFGVAACWAVAFVAVWERDRRAAVLGRWALTAAVPLAVLYLRPHLAGRALGVPGYFWPVLLVLVGPPALWLRARRTRRAAAARPAPAESHSMR